MFFEIGHFAKNSFFVSEEEETNHFKGFHSKIATTSLTFLVMFNWHQLILGSSEL